MAMMTKSSAIEWLRWIYQWQVEETVPSIVIAQRLFLTFTVSATTAERSYSKLKLIKSYLRSNMSQDRLSDISLISIEHEIMEKIDFGQVISNYASVNGRKVKI